MPTKKAPPVTAAVRVLRQQQIIFSSHLYDYEERGGALQGAQALGADPHEVIKTLIMEDENGQPLVVLMHGDCQVSTKALARTLGVKSITPCDPSVANRHSGYLVGGTSPFGTRKPMPVYVEASILELPRIYINGGKRGYLLGIATADLQRVLKATPVAVRIDEPD